MESQLLTIQTSNSSRLLSLPVEILQEIFRPLGWEDRLALAFTSKYLLQVSTFEPLWIPLPIFIGNGRLRKTPLFARSAAYLKMRRYLCVECGRHRLARKSYWKGKGTRTDDQLGWKERVTVWSKGFTEQCPTCWLDEEEEYDQDFLEGLDI